MEINLKRPGSVASKRILVTGGSSGIGRAAVLALLRDGAKVATCSRSVKELKGVRDAGALCVEADVSQPDQVKRLLSSIQGAWGGLDAIVNNAAVLIQGKLKEQSLEVWRETIETNLTAPWFIVREALPMMYGGNIVNITSGLGFFVMDPYNAYCISKAGLNMLTRALAQELGGSFRVNAVDPGVAKTNMNPVAGPPPEEPVPIIRYLVALDSDGPTGRCFKKSGEEVSW